MRLIKEVFVWIGSIVIAVVCALAINIFIFQPTEVRGSSMEATLSNQDRVIVSKIIHTLSSEPEYGDIIVIDSRVERRRTLKDDVIESFKYNVFTYYLFDQPEHVFWIKRVIGKAGDELEFHGGKVIRNGTPLEEPYINGPMEYTSSKKIVVPEGHVFVMGDNRNYSKDSRHIGFVPLDHVIGKYVIKY